MPASIFAIWKDPGREDLLMVRDPVIEQKSQPVFEKEGFCFAPYALSDKILFYSGKITECYNTEFLDSMISIPDDRSEDSKEDYTELVNRAIVEIKKGTFDKVVLARKQTIMTKDTFSLSSLFLDLVCLHRKL